MVTTRDLYPQDDFGNLTDYNAKQPKGTRSFFVFVTFTDYSRCLLSNIYAKTRNSAYKQALRRFADCGNYIKEITLYADDEF